MSGAPGYNRRWRPLSPAPRVEVIMAMATRGALMIVPGGRPRKAEMRSAMNAILYLLRTCCPWRYRPRDGFPPRSTVYNIFRQFQRE